jgi:ABC-2 type transport system ATP-binding protein
MERDTVLANVANLSKRFGEYRALSDLSFDIREGEILGLIGPNGSGKTTLMECVAGLLPCDGGSLRWRDAVLPPGRRKRAMFYLPDGIAPYGDLAVVDVLAFFAAAHGRARSETDEVVAALELQPVVGKHVGALSKGYRRRLLLALALLAPQPLLMLDEPFDGFDLRQVQSVAALLRRLRDGGRTLLLAIHQLTDAMRICDRFVLLDGGRLAGAGTLDELRQQAGIDSGGLEETFLALT